MADANGKNIGAKVEKMREVKLIYTKGE
jgi:hypothetical protein